MAVTTLLSERAPRSLLDRIEAPIGDSDPYGIDVQLSLYVCYELHYRGFAGVAPQWEWNPGLLHLRARLEEAFLSAVRRDAGDIDAGAAAELERLAAAPADVSGPAAHLRDTGGWEQMREYFVHRSLYHLKEGDPHPWAIPRRTGPARSPSAAGEFAESGVGRGGPLHRHPFADLMVAADLDPGYSAYIDAVPAAALAVVNLMTLFGLHRSHRGAAVGHFAATEITSSSGSRALLDALSRMNAPRPCREFYRAHVEADAVHGPAARAEVVGDLLNREPHLESDIVFGMRASAVVEGRLAAHLMSCWNAGDTSLRRPLV